MHQPCADNCFQGVSRGNAEGGEEIAGRRQIDNEGAYENRGPDAVAEQKQRREGNSGRRPDGRSASVQERKLQAELGSDEIDDR
jgi:hypothetical protein